MYVREARPEDSAELQALQAKSTVGKTLILSMVNAPDFFARANAYETYKVFVATKHDRIIGSAACAIRDGLVRGKMHRIGHEFQYFTSTYYRKRRVGSLLRERIEDYLNSEGVDLSYVPILEGNLPGMRLFEGHGFRLHRSLVMPGLAVYKEMDVAATGTIRPIATADLPTVAELLNQTWEGHDLYEPTSADALARFVSRTPEYSFENLLLLEDRGQILACLGFWDWGKLTQITVIAPSRAMRMRGLLMGIAGRLRPMPQFPKAGDQLKQMVLTPIGFKDPRHLAVLLRYVNNQALLAGIQQIFCVCERDHPLLSSMKGFIKVDTDIHLYVKPLQPDFVMGDRPVFLDGIDLQ